MLVLTRRKDEKIRLPDLNVTITLLKVKGKAVSLGVDAPEDVRILRGELNSFDGDAFDAPVSCNANRLLAASA